MGGFLAGFDRAAGAPDAARDLQAGQQKREQDKQQKVQMQLAPLHLASVALQSQLAPLIDPDTGKPRAGQEARYNELHDQLADVIGKQRVLLNPPPKEDPHGLGYLIHAATDKAHITKHAVEQAREAQKQKVADYQKQGQEEVAQTVQGIQPSLLTPDQQKEAARVKAGIEPKPTDLKPNLKNFRGPSGDIKMFDANDPSKIPQGYVLAPTGASASTPSVKPLEAGGVPYGVQDSATGKTYVGSQMNDPTTPAEVRETWKTIQDAKKAKQDEADKKDREREEHFLKSQEAIAARMGRSELFQAQMVGFREQNQVYKNLDQTARNDKEKVDQYAAAYSAPGNKSATDLALVGDYTAIIAKGGRKTQTEFNIARQIGSFKLNLEQKYKKATTGELPEELRKLYLDYMEAAAASSRAAADDAKPDLPEMVQPKGAAVGPKTKQLRNSQGGSAVDKFLKSFPTTTPTSP